jgi:uncharacterized membrane protein
MRSAARAVVGLLVVIGVASAIGRAVFVSDLMSRAEPVRNEMLAAVHDNPVAHTEQDLVDFDGRYAANAAVTRLHVVTGGLFLAFAPLQFAATVRRRYPALHRWSGRALLLLAALTTVGAFYLAFVVPFAGGSESLTIAFFGTLFLVALTRAFVAIRRRDVAAHREWIIRAFGLALAISTVRIVGAAFDLVWMPSGPAAERMFVVSLWIGWLATIAGAELWIRYTRPVGIGREPAKALQPQLNRAG